MLPTGPLHRGGNCGAEGTGQGSRLGCADQGNAGGEPRRAMYGDRAGARSSADTSEARGQPGADPVRRTERHGPGRAGGKAVRDGADRTGHRVPGPDGSGPGAPGQPSRAAAPAPAPAPVRARPGHRSPARATATSGPASGGGQVTAPPSRVPASGSQSAPRGGAQLPLDARSGACVIGVTGWTRSRRDLSWNPHRALPPGALPRRRSSAAGLGRGPALGAVVSWCRSEHPGAGHPSAGPSVPVPVQLSQFRCWTSTCRSERHGTGAVHPVPGTHARSGRSPLAVAPGMQRRGRQVELPDRQRLGPGTELPPVRGQRAGTRRFLTGPGTSAPEAAGRCPGSRAAGGKGCSGPGCSYRLLLCPAVPRTGSSRSSPSARSLGQGSQQHKPRLGDEGMEQPWGGGLGGVG